MRVRYFKKDDAADDDNSPCHERPAPTFRPWFFDFQRVGEIIRADQCCKQQPSPVFAARFELISPINHRKLHRSPVGL